MSQSPDKKLLVLLAWIFGSDQQDSCLTSTACGCWDASAGLQESNTKMVGVQSNLQRGLATGRSNPVAAAGDRHPSQASGICCSVQLYIFPPITALWVGEGWGWFQGAAPCVMWHTLASPGCFEGLSVVHAGGSLEQLVAGAHGLVAQCCRVRHTPAQGGGGMKLVTRLIAVAAT